MSSVSKSSSSELTAFTPGELTATLNFQPSVGSSSATYALLANITSPLKKVSRLGSWVYAKVFPSSWSFAKLSNDFVTSGYMPDSMIRAALKVLLYSRHDECTRLSAEDRERYLQSFLRQLHSLPIAILSKAANDQHYEVPPAFFDIALGPRRKYSCCLYNNQFSDDLASAEIRMFESYAERAMLKDGQRILDLGCGWGSFSLWAAEKYPNSTILGISNSNNQRLFILEQAKKKGLKNLNILTCDVNSFTKEFLANNNITQAFDRIISIEMMEHCKNYALLFERLSTMLSADGYLFVHIFVHNTLPYHFDGDGWMDQYFFSGGTMPSTDLFLYFQKHLALKSKWNVNGKHYARTLKQWRERMDRQSTQIIDIFKSTDNLPFDPYTYFQMWRVFMIACEECFAFNNGEAWYVSHYLFENKKK